MLKRSRASKTEESDHRNILDDLLKKMDNYDWSSIEDLPKSRVKTCQDLNYFRGAAKRSGVISEGPILKFDVRNIIEHSGIKLDGSILEFDAGATSIASFYPDVIAIDNNPRNVKHLRERGIRAIIGTIDELDIKPNSFDYIVSFSPLIVRGKQGYTLDEKGNVKLTSEYKEKIIGRTIEIARKKVLIASVLITADPPFVERIEKAVFDPQHHYHYVVYNAQKQGPREE